MSKHRAFIGFLFFLIVAFCISIYWALGAEQANYGMSQTQIARDSYNATYGAEQVTILAQIATTPQTNYGYSLTQIARNMYNQTYGANQVVLSTSTGEQVPFTNFSGLENGDVMFYNSTNTNWDNSHGLITFQDDSIDFAPETDSTTYFKISDADGGTTIFNVDATNERVGVGVDDPDTKVEILNAGTQLKLSFDGTDNTTFGVDTNGYLTITPSGDRVNFPIGNIYQDAGAETITNTLDSGDQTFSFGVRNLGDFSYRIAQGVNLTSNPIITIPYPNYYLGVLTTTPDRAIDAFDASNPQLRLTQADNSKYVEFQADSNGYLTITPSGDEILTDADMFITSASPLIQLENSTNEDTDGGRESIIAAKGFQSGGEESTLGYIQIAHENTADDEDGQISLYINDGNDGDSLNEAVTWRKTSTVTYQNFPGSFILQYNGGTVLYATSSTAQIAKDLNVQGSSPLFYTTNSTSEDTEGGRESTLYFEGKQSGSEKTRLAQIEVSHSGTGDDENGKMIVSINQGSDGDAPAEAFRINTNHSITRHSLSSYMTSENVADDGTITTLGTINSSGWGVATAGDNAEYCPFTFAADGTVTLLTDATANCANSSSDGNLCVYSSGSNGLTIENKLGSELTVKLDVKY